MCTLNARQRRWWSAAETLRANLSCALTAHSSGPSCTLQLARRLHQPEHSATRPIDDGWRLLIGSHRISRTGSRGPRLGAYVLERRSGPPDGALASGQAIVRGLGLAPLGLLQPHQSLLRHTQYAVAVLVQPGHLGHSTHMVFFKHRCAPHSALLPAHDANAPPQN